MATSRWSGRFSVSTRPANCCERIVSGGQNCCCQAGHSWPRRMPKSLIPDLESSDHYVRVKEYHDLLRLVLEKGKPKEDRTGVGTISYFGAQARFDLSSGFPLLTTKRVHFKSVAYELLCFRRGETNIRYLNEHGVTIWDEWADANGDLGRLYGAQWRDWRAADGRSINQLEQVVSQIRKDPDSRRLIV